MVSVMRIIPLLWQGAHVTVQNALLRQEVAGLRERLAKQEERIAELERRLNCNSRNSSLPPSLDPPAAPERRPPAPSGRGRGAQPGHTEHLSENPSWRLEDRN